MTSQPQPPHSDDLPAKPWSPIETARLAAQFLPPISLPTGNVPVSAGDLYEKLQEEFERGVPFGGDEEGRIESQIGSLGNPSDSRISVFEVLARIAIQRAETLLRLAHASSAPVVDAGSGASADADLIKELKRRFFEGKDEFRSKSKGESEVGLSTALRFVFPKMSPAISMALYKKWTEKSDQWNGDRFLYGNPGRFKEGVNEESYGEFKAGLLAVQKQDYETVRKAKSKASGKKGGKNCARKSEPRRKGK